MTQPTYYDVYDANDVFLMRAPLSTIEQVWGIREAARRRLVAETQQPGGVCSLYANGRPWLGGHHITVQEAVGPRANY